MQSYSQRQRASLRIQTILVEEQLGSSPAVHLRKVDTWKYSPPAFCPSAALILQHIVVRLQVVRLVERCPAWIAANLPDPGLTGVVLCTT